MGKDVLIAGGRTPWEGRNGSYADHRDTGAAHYLFRSTADATAARNISGVSRPLFWFSREG